MYNSILVIINQLTKYVYFVLYKESYTAKQLAYTFLRTIVSNYRLLDKVITD